MDTNALAHAALVAEGLTDTDAWKVIATDPSRVPALAATQKERVEREIKEAVARRYAQTEAGQREQATLLREQEERDKAREADANFLIAARGISPDGMTREDKFSALGWDEAGQARAEADQAAGDWNANAKAAGWIKEGGDH